VDHRKRNRLEKTRQITGKLWCWGGLLGIIVILLLKTEQVFALFMGITLIAGLLPVYSYLFYKKITEVNGTA
jgi:uncharacterized membrane protein